MMNNGIIEDWQNPQVFGINKEPYHATFMSYSNHESALKNNFCESPYYQTLNGKWQFYFCTNIDRVPADIHSLEDEHWGEINVPGSWQMQGYDAPTYLNTRYAFSTDSESLFPPTIPRENNRVGIYRKSFIISEEFDNRQVYIHFAGVESAFYLWVNGKKVGYSQNSFCPAEFNLTDYVIKGENTIIIQVLKWSDGSYLECQDMWRLNGIFREVYLFSTPNVHLCDFHISCDLDGNYEDAELKIKAKVINKTDKAVEPYYMDVEIYDHMDRAVEKIPFATGFTGNLNREWEGITWRPSTNRPKAILPNTIRSIYLTKGIENPRKWTAETPYLYKILLVLKDNYKKIVEVVTCKFGFRKVEIKEDQLLINGSPILLKGVNHHDFHYKTGRYLTNEAMEQDIVLMKQNNINAVRTAHYPHHPYFYELCNEYGLYVMDETNLETHGISYKDDVLPGNDPRWTHGVLDRVEGMVQRDKNHPSIIFWSMGNEAGFGDNIALMASYARTIDPTRLIHKRQMNSIGDVDSETYPSIDWLIYRANEHKDKPFLMNEYAHAMGNAMGNLKEYWEAIEAHKPLIGGFIWEWMDHGIEKRDAHHQPYFAYGGDFGNKVHDDNFCIDGILLPDRSSTPKLTEVKKVHEYIKVELPEKNSEGIIVNNRYYHKNLEDVELQWSLTEDGDEIKSGVLANIDIDPGEKKSFHIPINKVVYKQNVEYLLTIRFSLKENNAWAKKGHIIAWHQFIISNGENGDFNKQIKDDLNVIDNNGFIEVYNENITIKFNKKSGCIDQLVFNNKQIFTKEGPDLNVFRAPTDNDLRSSYVLDDNGWYKVGLNNVTKKVEDFRIELFDKKAISIFIHNTWKGKLETGFQQYSIYTVLNNGFIYVKNRIIPYGNLPVLPRIGLTFTMDSSFEVMKWYGRGPFESYPDRKCGAPIGLYESTVSDQLAPYVRPQEMGSKEDIRWLSLTDKSGSGVLIVPKELMSISSLLYTPMELDRVQHTHKLIESGKTILNIDYKQNGLGNASCGPEPLEKYKLYPYPVDFDFSLRPIDAVTSSCKVIYRETYDIEKYQVRFKDVMDELAPLKPRKMLLSQDLTGYIDPSDPEARKKAGYY
ncbi:glycoside hydrolase family 2 TIM barrel-domain containing protein [Vallitalea okinawensis]|uniref:glycoside hydrolase family 2 TIM barrel-domain containing protein n=1 Tax=Vallitalea okinawensis TaxID=2078660 RepID=UPI000CFABE5E|nr:glycoside hydrolase family 2 TIM barrel-domain containing protein [Vallitalea okinawensis]